MTSLRTALKAATTVLLSILLAACGGGSGSGDPPSVAPVAVFAFRMPGLGAEEEFRYATSNEAFIAKARAQLLLPVTGRSVFPAGPIAAGDGGVNLDWGWHFTDLSLVESAIELCDGRPSMVQADLSYWLGTVKTFCPWGAYVAAEVTGSYPLRNFALGQEREIAAEELHVRLQDVSDSRCPAAAVCIAMIGNAFASVDLLVRKGSGAAQPVTVTMGAGARDQQAVLMGYRFTLNALEPYPQTGPWPKDQYRATVTVQKL
jgi:hypothetical protein